MALELSRVVRKFPPRYGPEWGSGGIFGLKYWKGTLYYTLSFEGEAHFLSEEDEKVYSFELVGPGPHSGGDTYNAVEVVDEKIYFGGWVHAPAVYEGKKGKESRINFRNKYSHLHEYDVEEREVRLLWKESIHDERKWAGEISSIVYDPYEKTLLLSRLDGHENLGVYEYDISSGEMRRISEDPSLKGTLLNEFACFDSSSSFLSLEGGLGVKAVQFYDLIERKMEKFSVKDATSKALDGDPVFAPLPGCMASAYARLFLFCRGCILVGNPVIGEDFAAIRTFDFLGGYSPQRTMAIPYGGGLLVAYNAYTHGSLSKEVDSVWKYLNEIWAPSVLLYISPPEVRIVGVFGARITSLDEFSSGILIGWNTMANVGEANASPFDTGVRGISFLNSPLSKSPPPFEALIPGERMVGHFGGIPVAGYREPRIRYLGTRDNEIEIHEALLSLPPQELSRDKYKIKPGESLDLSSYSGILSFKLSREDLNAKLLIDLRR